MPLSTRDQPRRKANLPMLMAVSPAAAYVLALLVIPFLFLIYLSLHEYDPIAGYKHAYTLGNYFHLIQYQTYAESLIGTARLGVVVTLITLIIGYPIAYYIARTRSYFVPIVAAIVVTPMFISVVVRGFGWIVLLGREGPLNDLLVTLHLVSEPVQFLYTLGAVIVGLVHIELPLVVLPIASVLRGIDTSLDDAARSLGASGPRVFWTIVFPISLPGVAAGCLLVFSHVIAAFILPALLGSERIKLMSTMIYQQILTVGNVPLGAALGVVMVAAAFFVVGLVRVLPHKLEP